MDSELADDATRARAATVPWLVRIPSPVHFAAVLALAWLLQRMFPLAMPAPALERVLQVAGTLCANAGLVLAIWCIVMFWRRRTTLMPAGQPSGLVVRGPYRVTRNPNYIALALAYAGVAAMLDLLWALLLMPLPLAALQRVVIPHEEARLAEAFGDGYAAYRRRVPRWLLRGIV